MSNNKPEELSKSDVNALVSIEKLALSQNTPENVSSSDANALAWILKGDYKVVASFHDMPKEIQNAIFQNVGKTPDPNQKFYKTKEEKEAMFNMGGFSKDKAFVLLDTGDIYYPQFLFIMKRDPYPDVLYWGCPRKAVSSLEQLKAIIESGDLSVFFPSQDPSMF